MPTNLIARGSASNLLVKEQANFDTAATGNFVSTLFYSESLAPGETPEEDPIIGLDRVNDRDQTERADGLYTLEGGLVVPMDINHFGVWLTGLFDYPSTTGSEAPYEHEFLSGAAQLPYLTLEFEKRKNAAFFQYLGMVLSGFSFSMSREAGFKQVELSLMGRNEVKLGSSGGGTPATQMARAAIPNRISNVKIDGAAAGSIVSASFAYDNGLTEDASINNSKFVNGYDLDGVATCTGELQARYTDETYFDMVEAGAFHSLELIFERSASESISFYMPAVKFEKGPIAPIAASERHAVDGQLVRETDRHRADGQGHADQRDRGI
ncbi:phage tail tube protein [uncultured Cohaesibacter sp.]|uniref:phage tail tube protein n=1 Tax=uncultured Cohaesibacter sp. TaxID=1002546 RepID=UPI0029C71429|nr:phage tail tube protein [uncultured Cohaesibacter sp.]